MGLCEFHDGRQSKYANSAVGQFWFCQAQSQLQLNWTELALISAYPPPTQPEK